MWTDADAWNDNVACLACFPDIVSEPLRATISVFLSEIGSTNLDFFRKGFEFESGCCRALKIIFGGFVRFVVDFLLYHLLYMLKEQNNNIPPFALSLPLSI